jgi:hypothetical protein
MTSDLVEGNPSESKFATLLKPDLIITPLPTTRGGSPAPDFELATSWVDLKNNERFH